MLFMLFRAVLLAFFQLNICQINNYAIIIIIIIFIHICQKNVYSLSGLSV